MPVTIEGIEFKAESLENASEEARRDLADHLQFYYLTIAQHDMKPETFYEVAKELKLDQYINWEALGFVVEA